MHRRLRQVVRTPPLRVLAWLAWLLLAASPVFAAPVGVGGAHDGPAASMPKVDHAAHDGSAVTADCCSTPGVPGHAATDCHCPATCASALPALAMVEMPLVRVAVTPPPRHGAMAPDQLRSPPLRPPLPPLPR
jgi:hypothetical protein